MKTNPWKYISIALVIGIVILLIPRSFTLRVGQAAASAFLTIFTNQNSSEIIVETIDLKQ